jgi:hypothetical protein
MDKKKKTERHHQNLLESIYIPKAVNMFAVSYFARNVSPLDSILSYTSFLNGSSSPFRAHASCSVS